MAGESLNTQQRMDVALDALMDDESQQKKEQAEKEKQRQQEKEKQKQRELRKQQQQQNKQNKQKNQRSSNKTKNRSGHKSKNGGRKTSGHGNARRGQRTSKNSGKLKKKGSDINLSLSPLPAPTMKKDESVTNSNWGLNDQSVTSVNASGRRIRQYRMTLVGYSKVGKTALCTQFVENKFKNDYPRHKELLFKKKIDLPEMPTYRFMVDILGKSCMFCNVMHYAICNVVVTVPSYKWFRWTGVLFLLLPACTFADSLLLFLLFLRIFNNF